MMRRSGAFAVMVILTTLGEGACGGIGGGPVSPIRDWEPPRPPSIERPSIGCGEHEQAALRKQIAEKPDHPAAGLWRDRLARCRS